MLLSTLKIRKRWKPSSGRMFLLNGCNSLLIAYQHHYGPPGLQVDFYKAQKSSQLNAFFRARGVRGVLEKNNYSAADTVLVFIAAFFEHVADGNDNPVLAKIHIRTMSINLLAPKLCLEQK